MSRQLGNVIGVGAAVALLPDFASHTDPVPSLQNVWCACAGMALLASGTAFRIGQNHNDRRSV